MNAAVSVIIAARNEARRLGECLTSLRDQTHRPLEIIVVDDGSTDGTAAVARGFAGVRTLRVPHGGKARAVAAGAAVATGTVFCFLDADMVFAPDYVQALVAPILDGRAVGTAHAIELVANPDNRWARCWQQRAGLPPGDRLHLSADALAAGSPVYRAVLAARFREVGGFDDVGYLDDRTLAPKVGASALWVRDARCRHYNVERLGEVEALGRWAALSVYRQHGGKAVLTYLPPRSLLHGLRDAWRHGNPVMVPYVMAYEWGVLRGLMARARSGA